MTDYAKMIASVFARHGVDAKVDGFTRGPAVTRYECSVGRGVKVRQIAALQQELAYETAARSVLIEAPIPGKSAVGIQIPNDDREMVAQADIPPAAHPLEIGIGKDIEGQVITARLDEMPHLLVAGTTSSGKSTFLNSMLVSLLAQSPDDVRLLLVDPKAVELTQYNGVSHLLEPVITDADDAVIALKGLVDEMEVRFRAMATVGARNIDGLGFPYIVCVVDELADIVMQAKVIEAPIVRLCQKGRAAGIHLILATQKPTANVLSSLIKSNAPSRLSFAVSSSSDSRVILDAGGAEQLLGKGDALYRPLGQRDAIRIQGALVTDQEIAEAVKQATLEETPTEQFPAVTVEMSGLESIAWRVPVQHSLDDIVQYAMKAANNAARYRRWIPSLPHTLHESEAVTRLILELEEAHQALAEITDRLKGMEKVA